MPRTRGQQEKLLESGIPPTPPQQLATPKRITKAKPQVRKPRPKDEVPPTISRPVSTRARGVRARTNSASQSDQSTKAPEPVPKKRIRNAKAPKKADRTDEEATNVVNKVLEAPQASAEEAPKASTEAETSLALQAQLRETPSYNHTTPVSFVRSPMVGKAANAPAASGSPLPEDVKSITEADQGSTTTEISGNARMDTEPGLVETNSNLSFPAALSVSPREKLEEIVIKQIPAFLDILRNHHEIKGNAAIEKLLTDGKVSVTIGPVSKKLNERVPLQTVEHNEHQTLEPETPAADINSQNTNKRKALQIEQPDPENASHKRVRLEDEQTKRVPVLFDDKGMLSLRAYKDVPARGGMSSDEENTNNAVGSLCGTFSQQTDVAPETPRPSGWALSNFLPSARTVTKFLPGFTTRTPAVAPAPPAQNPHPQEQSPTPAPTTANIENSPTTPLQTPQVNRSSQSEPRPVNSEGERGRRAEHRPAATTRASRRHRRSKSKHGLKTKGEREEIRKRDEMIASLRAQLEAQNQEKEAQAEKAAEAQKDISAQMQAEVQKAGQQTPGDPAKQGKKRKAESPEVIPNPPGGGYGMVLDFFGQDSDSDDDTYMDDANVQVTPTQPPSKKARLSGGPAPPIIGDPLRATPYTGTKLALSPLPTEAISPRDRVLDLDMDAGAEDQVPSVSATPTNGPTMTFTVPSPGDSDDDSDDPLYVESTQTPQAIRIPGLNYDHLPTQTSPVTTNQQHASPANAAPIKYSIATGLPIVPQKESVLFPYKFTFPPLDQISGVSQTPPVPNVALEKARQTALKHKPQQPSRLRESSRLSSYTIGTEIGDDETEQNTDTDQASKPGEAVIEEAPEMRDPYFGREMRQSQRDPMLLEPVPIPSEPSLLINDNPEESSSDNATSPLDLPQNLQSFSSFEEYEQNMSSRVKDFLTPQLDTDSSHFNGQADAMVADNFSQYGNKSREKPQQGAVSTKMHTYVDMLWDQTDDEAAVERFDDEFETWLQKPLY